MAELSKYFPSVQEYETYVNGGDLPSNVLAVVLTEDGDDVAQISFATNDITGAFETFTCVGDQAYNELLEQYNEKVQKLQEANETIGQLRLDLAAATATIEAADTALQAI